MHPMPRVRRHRHPALLRGSADGPSPMKSLHIPEEWRGVTSVLTPSGEQQMAVLSEAGVRPQTPWNSCWGYPGE